MKNIKINLLSLALVSTSLQCADKDLSQKIKARVGVLSALTQDEIVCTNDTDRPALMSVQSYFGNECESTSRMILPRSSDVLKYTQAQKESYGFTFIPSEEGMPRITQTWENRLAPLRKYLFLQENPSYYSGEEETSYSLRCIRHYIRSGDRVLINGTNKLQGVAITTLLRQKEGYRLDPNELYVLNLQDDEAIIRVEEVHGFIYKTLDREGINGFKYDFDSSWHSIPLYPSIMHKKGVTQIYRLDDEHGELKVRTFTCGLVEEK